MSIIIKNLYKRYGNDSVVINDLSLTIDQGIYGLLGKNGAGKTTLLRILSTIIEPTSGSVELCKIVISKKNQYNIKEKVGYLPQEFGFYDSLTVNEALDYMGMLNKMSLSLRKKRIEFMLGQVHLEQERKKKVCHLSGGMKRRLGIAQAMLHEPQILIVDEPTAGVDPVERIEVRSLLSDFAKNHTVLLSTHIVEDIASTCRKLAIMDRGHLLFSGETQDLIGQIAGHVWSCSLKDTTELDTLKKEHWVITQQFIENRIEARVLTLDTEKPSIVCQKVSPSVEDAYLLCVKGVNK